MARIIFDDRFTDQPTITLTDKDDAALVPIIGDINDLDSGPARFELNDSADRVKLGFSSTGSGTNPTAVIVLVSIVETNDDLDAGAELTRTTTIISGSGALVDVFGTDVALTSRGEIGPYATVLPQSGGVNVYEMAFSSPVFTGNVVFDIKRVIFLQNYTLPQNVDKGWGFRYVDLSQVEAADSGEVYSTQRRILREVEFSFSGRLLSSLFIDSSGNGLFKIFKSVGRTRFIMLIPDEASDPLNIESSVLGRVVSESSVLNESDQHYSSSRLVIREV